MKAYSLIPHTGDVRLHAGGKSHEKLFAAALEGMNRILNKEYEKHLNKHTITEELTVTAYDITSLLIDFLSEVLTRSHIRKAIFHTIDYIEIQGNTLNARLLGTKADKFMEDIKAVTYHEANVRQNDKGYYETTVVFDI